MGNEMDSYEKRQQETHDTHMAVQAKQLELLQAEIDCRKYDIEYRKNDLLLRGESLKLEATRAAKWAQHADEVSGAAVELNNIVTRIETLIREVNRG